MVSFKKWISLVMIALSGLQASCSLLPKQAPKSGIDRQSMDMRIAPGTDFYRYANGQWLAHTEIPEDKAGYSSFTQIYDHTREQVKSIIDTLNDQSYPAGTDGQRISNLYKSYMNWDTREAIGLAPLLPDLKNIDRISTRDDLAIAFAQASIRGGGTPFSFWVSSDEKNPERYRVYLTQSGLGLPDRDYYLKSDENTLKIREQYQAHIAHMFQQTGATDADIQAQSVLALETALAKIQWSKVDNRDRKKTYNVVRTQALPLLLGYFDWQTYLNVSAIAQESEMVVRQPEYLKALDSLMRNTPMRDWHAYLKWHLIADAAPYLNRAFDDAHFAFFSTALYGVKAKPEPWERGVGVVNGYLGQALGQFYVQQFFPPQAKARAEQMVAHLKAAFHTRVESLDWLSPTTKQQARAKLRQFTAKIGYPEQWQDYTGLDLDDDDLYGNIQRLRHFSHAKEVNQLGKPVDKKRWYMSPQTVNAYYNASWNEIVFPAAILQPPFFDPRADDAVNYGAIGAIIGHEMSHGFDDQGALFDGQGVLRNWWLKQDFDQFKQRTQALVQQFNGYQPLPGQNINGALTLGENIADLSGLSLAYQAYQRASAGKSVPVIDGFTADQRFLLAYAQMWKAKQRPHLLQNRLLTDPHAPPEYRVNGIVRHLDVFYRAFAVKPDEPLFLAPKQRIAVW